MEAGEREGAEMKDHEIDLHGYYPEGVEGVVHDAVLTAWEVSAPRLRIIHGHGYNRRDYCLFANTNTGPLGMAVRRLLREDRALRQYMYAKFDCSDMGFTTVRLRSNVRDDIRMMIASQGRRRLLSDKYGNKVAREIHKYVSKPPKLTACGLMELERARIPGAWIDNLGNPEWPADDVSWHWNRVTCVKCVISNVKQRRLAASVAREVRLARARKEEEQRRLHAAQMVPGSPEWRAAEEKHRRKHAVDRFREEPGQLEREEADELKFGILSPEDVEELLAAMRAP